MTCPLPALEEASAVAVRLSMDAGNLSASGPTFYAHANLTIVAVDPPAGPRTGGTTRRGRPEGGGAPGGVHRGGKSGGRGAGVGVWYARPPW